MGSELQWCVLTRIFLVYVAVPGYCWIDERLRRILIYENRQIYRYFRASSFANISGQRPVLILSTRIWI
jgi:hypothetical protein